MTAIAGHPIRTPDQVQQERVFVAFVKELATLLSGGYTGNITVRAQAGVIRNYRTEQVQVPGGMLVERK